MGFEKRLKEMKPFIFDMASQFIEDKAKQITKELTKAHHQILKQFIAFKDRSTFQMKQADRMHKYVAKLEERLAMRSPTLEAEHAIDDRTALTLYDCLMPQLREHRKFRIAKDAQFSIEDFNAQLKIRTLEH